jgi:GGDEF domain-containing protein
VDDRAVVSWVIRRWWLVMLVALDAMLIAYLVADYQPRVYESTASYLVRLSAGAGADKSIISAVDTLSNRPAIVSTYASVATSRAVREQAAADIGVPDDQLLDYQVRSRIVPGTNTLEIAVRGNDPATVASFANAIGERTRVLSGSLYTVYTLEPLDTAFARAWPASPNVPFDVALGGGLGLLLGVVLAALLGYLRMPMEQSIRGILDDETGLFDKRYFSLRLREEMARAKRAGYPLSVAMIEIDRSDKLAGITPEVRSLALQQLGRSVESTLRDTGIAARIDERIIAVMLPETTAASARDTIDEITGRLASRLGLDCTVGITVYRDSGTEQAKLLARATKALEESAAADGDAASVRAFSGNGSRRERSAVG